MKLARKTIIFLNSENFTTFAFRKSERKNEKNFDDDGNSGWTYSVQHKQ